MKSERAVLKVGWASREIVPDGPVALRGQFYERVSQYVRDSLTVTALALEQLDDRGAACAQAVLVSCDLATAPSFLQQRVQSEVAVKLPGLDTSCIVLFATHTHTGPMLAEPGSASAGLTASAATGTTRNDLVAPAAYFALVVRRITEAVEEAWNARAVGGVSAATEIAVTGHCRLAGYRDGSVRMYGNTQTADFAGILGPNDPYLEMLLKLSTTVYATAVHWLPPGRGVLPEREVVPTIADRQAGFDAPMAFARHLVESGFEVRPAR